MSETTSAVITLAVIILSTGLLYWFQRKGQDPTEIKLRPLGVQKALEKQAGIAVETGRYFHISPGNASLAGKGNPTSLAGLAIVDYLSDQACKIDVPPIITVGDGSLLVGAQDSMRRSYQKIDRSQDFKPDQVRYLAAESQPMAFAAGMTEEIRDLSLTANIMVGRFGSEAAIMTEAADRLGIEQILGSDDPLALSVMAPFSEELLIGEELFAASAYVQPKPILLASLRVQDTLRILVVVGILLAAIIYLVVG